MAKISWNKEELHRRDNSGASDSANKDLGGGLQQGYELGSLTDGLMAYLSFDEGIQDEALFNDVTDNTSAGYVSGNVGTHAKDFDGSDDHLFVSGPLLDTTKPPWTFSTWIKRKGGFGTQQKFFGQSPADSSYQSGQISIEFSESSASTPDAIYVNIGGVGTEIIGSTSINDSNWHHIVVTFDGSKWNVFVDGTKDGSGNPGSPSNVGDDPIWLGANYNNYSYISMDDVRIYDRVLSTPEIKALYQRTSTQKITDQDRLTTGLVGHWPLNEDAAGIAYDLSGNNNDAKSVTGTSTDVGLGGAKGRIFDGGDDSIHYTSIIASGPTDLTFSTFVYPAGTGGREIFRSHPGDWQDVAVRYDGGGNQNISIVFADNSNDTKTSATGSTTVPKNEWTHVAVTFKQSDNAAILYVNGAQDATLTEAWDSDVNMYLGQDHNNNRHFAGKMEDVRIYNRDLTQSEIKTLADMGGIK